MIKTVTLTGSELKVEGLGGFNTFVQNLGSVVLYASKYPGITAGADNVAEIPAGSGKLISTTNGTVYLLGTGKAEVTGLDGDSIIAAGGAAVYSVGGGGSAEGGGASFMEFVNYADTHDELTLDAAKEYTDLLMLTKADKSEIPTTLPANGGDADTVGGFTVGCDVPADAAFTDTIVDISGKLDSENPVVTGTFTMNSRKANSAIGTCSFAAGYSCGASGNYSCAVGLHTNATKRSAHAEGEYTTASGEKSHAEGEDTTASAGASHAEGLGTTASGASSHAEGAGTIASGISSHAEGSSTTASNLASHASGKYNKAMTDGGMLSNIIGDVFVIGNGTEKTALSNAFRVTYSGAVYGVGAFNTTGADYAEYIKPWFDHNPDGEDRVGYFVTIKDGKLRFAEPGDYVVGITSGNPSIVGNGDEDWLGRWQRDEFNRIIMEDIEEEIEMLDAETGEIVLEKTGKVVKNARFKANPDYDPSVKYIERKNRPEWDYVGMIGVLPLRDDGSCVAGGFAKCGAGGVATKADEWECHKTFFVIERISEDVIAVEMR